MCGFLLGGDSDDKAVKSEFGKALHGLVVQMHMY